MKIVITNWLQKLSEFNQSYPTVIFHETFFVKLSKDRLIGNNNHKFREFNTEWTTTIKRDHAQKFREIISLHICRKVL